ncbi:hypothetical protein [Brasilonema bromeliae]
MNCKPPYVYGTWLGRTGMPANANDPRAAVATLPCGSPSGGRLSL